MTSNDMLLHLLAERVNAEPSLDSQQRGALCGRIYNPCLLHASTPLGNRGRKATGAG